MRRSWLRTKRSQAYCSLIALRCDATASSLNCTHRLLTSKLFKTVYLAESRPLGLHSDAIRFVLNARGDGQLYDPSRFSLWSVANHRLLSRQILLHEEPDPVQLELLNKLNHDRPDIRIWMDVLRMATLCALVKKLVAAGVSEVSQDVSGEAFEEARRLLETMQSFIADTEQWMSTMSGVWKPRIVDAQTLVQPAESQYPSDHPLAHFYCSTLLSYPDVWLAFIWNFHAACQVVLRESLIELIRFAARLSGQELSVFDLDRIQTQQTTVKALSSSIIASFPPLMGFTDASGEHPTGSSSGLSQLQGTMAGRCLVLFAMNVVREAEFSPLGHKHTASKVTEWIYSNHALS